MMDDAFFAEIRTALERRRAELTDLSQSTESDRAPVELDQTRMGRLSRMDAIQQQAMAKTAGNVLARLARLGPAAAPRASWTVRA